MKRTLIFGCGQFAQVIHAYLREDSDYIVEAFTVDRQQLSQRTLNDLPVIAFEDVLSTHPPSQYSMFIGVGYSNVNANRRRIYEAVKQLGYETPTYISSRAYNSDSSTIGDSCIVFEHVSIQPYANVGNNTVIWSGSIICHHSTVGENVFIASNVTVSGNCLAEDNAFIGAGAVLRDGIRVGKSAVIGAGAILLRDAPSRSVFKATSTIVDGRDSGSLTKI